MVDASHLYDEEDGDKCRRANKGIYDWRVSYNLNSCRIAPLLTILPRLRNFKDARRYLEQSQKTFDATLARYVGQSKTKELSSLRRRCLPGP